MSDDLDPSGRTDDSVEDGPLSIPDELPILPLRDTVLFPNSFMPLSAHRRAAH